MAWAPVARRAAKHKDQSVFRKSFVPVQEFAVRRPILDRGRIGRRSIRPVPPRSLQVEVHHDPLSHPYTIVAPSGDQTGSLLRRSACTAFECPPAKTQRSPDISFEIV